MGQGRGRRGGGAGAAEPAAPQSCEAHSSVTLRMGVGSLNSLWAGERVAIPGARDPCGVGWGVPKTPGGLWELTCSGCLVWVTALPGQAQRGPPHLVLFRAGLDPRPPPTTDVINQQKWSGGAQARGAA